MKKYIIRSVPILLVYLLCALSILPARGFAAPGDAVISEKRANSYTADFQYEPAVAMTPSGNFQIVWTSVDNPGFPSTASQDSYAGGIFSQRFNAIGVPLGDEVQVNTSTLENESLPQIAIDPDGKTIINWNTPDSTSISYYQRYLEDGSVSSTQQSLANISTRSDVAFDASGGFVAVTAFSTACDGSFGCPAGSNAYDINIDRYDNSGMFLNTFPVDSNQYLPGLVDVQYITVSIASRADGGFVVVWVDSSPEVVAGLYDAAGNQIGANIPMGANINNPPYPDVAMDASGDFVIVWAEADNDLDGIFMRRFNANGNEIGGPLPTQVNTYDSDSQTDPAVAMDAAGNFVVTWDSLGQDGQSKAVIAKRYDASGNALAEEFIVNDFTPGVQGDPDVAMDADGDFVITWSSIGQGVDEDVYYKVYSGGSSVDLSLVADTGGIAFVDTRSNFTYNLTVTNNSPAPTLTGDVYQDLLFQHVNTASGITVKDNLDPAVEFVDASGTDWNCAVLPEDAFDNVVTCNYNKELAPAESSTVSLNVIAPENATRPGSSATVSAVQSDPDESNNTDLAGINVTGAGGSGLGSGALGGWVLLFAVVPLFFRIISTAGVKKYIIALALVLTTQTVCAEQDIVTWVGINKKNMEFGRSFDTSSTDTTFFMGTLSVTALYDGFYVTLYGEAPLKKDDIQGGTITADRDEINLTVGCNCLSFAKELAIFAGYASANTRIEGSVPTEKFSEDHTDQGFYVGGSLPVYDGRQKSLSLSAAYARQNGKVAIVDEFVNIDNSYSGRTAGFSYAVTLVGALGKSMNYSLAYKIQKYFFETDVFGVDKNFTNLSASFSYLF